MRRTASTLRSIGRTLVRIEVTFVLLLLAMTAIGRAGDLDARIKLALADAIRMYRAEQVIAENENADKMGERQRATAALPRGRSSLYMNP